MSQEDVEILRAAFAAWNAGDMEAVFAHFHPELVYHPRADEPDPSPHVGRNAYERLVYGFVESFSEVTFEVLELIDAGDRVVALIREREIGRTSGAPVDARHVAVWTLADGKVVRMQIFDNREQALKAVGLAE